MYVWVYKIYAHVAQ